MNTQTSDLQAQPQARFVFRILAGVIAAFGLLISLPLAVLEFAGLEAWLLWFCSLFVGVGFGVVAWTGYWPFSFTAEKRNVGTGETRESPDNRYTATVYEWSSESFWGTTRHWFIFEIGETQSGQVIQRLETDPIAGFEFDIEETQSGQVIQGLETDPIAGPYFGSRSSHGVVHWQDDSEEVIFKFPSVDIKMRVKPEKESG